jgi:hypothetical protein
MTIEQAKELKQSVLFSMLCDEIRDRIEKLRTKLEDCPQGTPMTLIQAKIATYRELLTLPQDVIDREE